MRLNVLKTYKLYINGAFPRTESGRYYDLKNDKGELIANMCRASRKDFRNAMQAARKAQPGWQGRTAYNIGQIIYRIAEILDGRSDQFVEELKTAGYTSKQAEKEVQASINRLVHYTGWSDKYQQLFSSVNPVAGPYFNFSKSEPTGVVAIVAPDEAPLLGLVSTLIPVILGGNTAVVLASSKQPALSITFAEVLATSDVPAGIVNILTGFEDELISHISTHMDVNAIWYARDNQESRKMVQENAALNVQRITLDRFDWSKDEAQSPYIIHSFQETKTTWHPVGF
jgi:acyl-CoA reductase-like NAD-dependent aldehyde dehydrogenase